MLFQTLDKLRKQSVLAAIIMMSLGVVMLICPEKYINSLIVTAGYIMIIFALVVILEFIAGKKALIHYFIFTGALILGVFGVFILIYNENVLGVLRWLFGIVLVQDGFLSILNAILFARRSNRRGWWILIVLACMLMTFGMLIIVNPWWNSPLLLMKVIGGALQFSAFANALRLIWVWPFKKEEGDGRDEET